MPGDGLRRGRCRCHDARASANREGRLLVEHLSGLLRRHEVTLEAWYVVWLFSDWLDLPLDETDVPAVAAIELAGQPP